MNATLCVLLVTSFLLVLSCSVWSVVNLSPQGLLTQSFPVGCYSAWALFHCVELVEWGLLGSVDSSPAPHWVKSLSQRTLLQLLFLLFPSPRARGRAQGLDPLQASPSPLF